MSDHANEPSCSKPSAEDSLQLFLDSTDFDDMFDFFMQTSKEDSPRFTSSISCSGTSVAIAGDDAGEPGVTAETPPIPPDEELVRVQVQAPAGPGQRILPNEWQSWRLKLDKKQEAELKNRAAAFWTRETQAASMRRAMWASSNLPIARIKRIIQSGLVRPLMLGGDVAQVVAFLSELLIKSITCHAAFFTALEGRRTIQLKDVQSAVRSNQAFDLLIDVVIEFQPESNEDT
uniref:Transcription factor CBF/NF-Y/archaeal histone domain-containing protein n=1 Tax=Chrysotila carterae TaxID=13221 RepID=A0A7S4ESS1_CHRCT